MFGIISCTNRQGSKTLLLSQKVLGIYQNLKIQPLHLIDLRSVPFQKIKRPYLDSLDEVNLLNKCKGIILVIPEYNGSFPGIFKYFIDHWDESKTMAYRPFCLIGIGSGSKGGMQAIGHIQNILFYRKAYIYPEFTLVQSETIEDNKINDAQITGRLLHQASGFVKFVNKIQSS